MFSPGLNGFTPGDFIEGKVVRVARVTVQDMPLTLCKIQTTPNPHPEKILCSIQVGHGDSISDSLCIHFSIYLIGDTRTSFVF